MVNRYTWQHKPAPPRYELVDRVCSSAVAIIVFDGERQEWEWTRFTTRVLHGAPPTQGSTNADLQTAKQQVLMGLRDQIIANSD